MKIIPANSDLKPLAQRFWALGFNVVPTDPDKKPRVKWASDPNWKTTRQTAADVAAMPWQKAHGIAAVCGAISDGLVCLDFDQPPDRRAVDHVLAALDLPPDYAWLEPTPRGGWHLWLIAPHFPLNGTGKLDREGLYGGHVELRYEGVLTTLRFAVVPPDLPTTRDPAAIIAVHEAVTVAPPPKPERQPYTAPDLPSDAGERAEVERRVRAAIANTLVKRGGKAGVYNCPLEHGSQGKDFLFGPEVGQPIGGCMGKHAGALTRWVDLAAALDLDVSQIARDVAAECRPARAHQTSTSVEPLAWHWSEELRHKLLTIHHPDPSIGERWLIVRVNGTLRAVLPDLAGPVMIRERWIDAIHRGVISADTVLSLDDVRDLFGLTHYTARQALELGEKFLFCRKGTYSSLGNKLNAPFRINRTSAGNRQPSIGYLLNDDDTWLTGFWQVVKQYALRAAVYGTRIPDNAHVEYGLTPEQVEAADQARAELYAQHADERATAEAEIEQRFTFLSGKYGAENQRRKPAAILPAERATGPARYRDTLIEQRRGEVEAIQEPVQRAMACEGYRSRKAYQRSCERRGTVRDPQWEVLPIEQVSARVKGRGWGYEPMADEHGEVTAARVQVASIERPATAEEIDARAVKRETQREAAKVYRVAQQATLAALPPAIRAQMEAMHHTPLADQDGPPGTFPVWYAVAQAKMSLPGYQERGRVLYDDQGESLGPASVQVYWLAAAGALALERITREQVQQATPANAEAQGRTEVLDHTAGPSDDCAGPGIGRGGDGLAQRRDSGIERGAARAGARSGATRSADPAHRSHDPGSQPAQVVSEATHDDVHPAQRAARPGFLIEPAPQAPAEDRARLEVQLRQRKETAPGQCCVCGGAAALHLADGHYCQAHGEQRARLAWLRLLRSNAAE